MNVLILKRITSMILTAIIAAAPAAAQSPDNETYALYRDSVLDASMRVHIATFDAADGADYNRENWMLARDLFLAQAGVRTNFWCEPGRYREER